MHQAWITLMDMMRPWQWNLHVEKIAKAIGSRHDEIIFTSGATESDNIALIGTMERYQDRGDHLITCATEHKAVLDTTRYLESAGKKVTYLPVDRYGQIDLNDLKDAVTDKTVMMSILAANNEIGTIADIAEIGKIAHDNDVIFHTDAAQAVGHIPVNVQKMNIDMMSNLCTQDVRTKRCWCAIHTWNKSKGKAFAYYARWRTRTGHTFWYSQCPWNCRVWKSNRDCSKRDGNRKQEV